MKEETGLKGALAFDPALLSARLLINLDSGESDELTVGCAGAAEVTMYFSPTTETIPDGWSGREVVVSGLKGGHSGVQIHERLANAIKLLVSVLIEARDGGVDFHLGSIEGGSTHNVIPHTAAARLSIAPNGIPELETTLARVMDMFRAEWGANEPDLALEGT